MSIANRILFGFVVLILMLAGLGWYGLSQLSLVRDTTDTIVTRDLAMMRQLDSVRTESLTVQEARNTAVSRFLLRRLDRSVPDDDSQRIWNDAHGRSEAAIRDAHFWSPDRLHLNPAGHARVAHLVMREIGLDSGEIETPPGTRHSRGALAEARYYREYVWPWVARRLTGRSTGDNITAKFAEWKVFEPARG